MVNIEQYHQIKKELGADVKLIVVSKTKPAEQIQILYNEGHRKFGENRAQEMQQKYEQLPQDVEWHFIGKLQTNKVKYIAPFVTMIESVDSFNLLKMIQRQALRNERIIPCLLQFHIAQEESKSGFTVEEAVEMLRSPEFKEMTQIQLCGVMGMGTFTDDTSLTRKEFQSLFQIFTKLKAEFFPDDPNFKEISMGMSGDYPIAIEEGSTMVRIGSAIFGAR